MEKMIACKTKYIGKEKRKLSYNEIYDDSIKLDQKYLLNLLKCPLCTGIFRTPTIINECMHTFCRSCIIKYINKNGKQRCNCPVCGTGLGGRPMESLKYHHSISSIIEILFPEFDEIDQKNNVYII